MVATRSASTSALFKPIKVGNITLQHRVALAPLTRVRADANHVPHVDLVKTYYKQRASAPGTLLISEATVIAPKAGGYDNVPGIYSEEQVAAWKQITDAIHAQGSHAYMQLWALGRAARPSVLVSSASQLGLSEPFPFVSASNLPIDKRDATPRPLTLPEIKEYIQLYATAAKNAIRAGFDGVEIHGANGYLVDQFLEDVSNVRTDQYGGSIENRARFALEVIEAIVHAVGESRTSIRLSPWSRYQNMGERNPIPTFTYLIERIKSLYPDFAYIHLTEPEAELDLSTLDEGVVPSNDFARKIWAPRPFISANEHNRESAFRFAEEKGDIVAFGRWFISNPDLVRRLKEGIELTPFDMSTFYLPESAKGYIDYPFAAESSSSKQDVVEEALQSPIVASEAASVTVAA